MWCTDQPATIAFCLLCSFDCFKLMQIDNVTVSHEYLQVQVAVMCRCVNIIVCVGKDCKVMCQS